MTKSFSVKIITPTAVIYEGEAVSLVAPSETGYFGILADHTPFVANLVAGRITVKEPSGGLPRAFDSKGSGFLEVLENNVTVLLR